MVGLGNGAGGAGVAWPSPGPCYSLPSIEEKRPGPPASPALVWAPGLLSAISEQRTMIFRCGMEQPKLRLGENLFF